MAGEPVGPGERASAAGVGAADATAPKSARAGNPYFLVHTGLKGLKCLKRLKEADAGRRPGAQAADPRAQAADPGAQAVAAPGQARPAWRPPCRANPGQRNDRGQFGTNIVAMIMMFEMGGVPVRVGVLGAGRIGGFHAGTLSRLSAVESLVVSDPVASLARDVAERSGAQVAGTPEELVASGVDGVVIAATTDAHPELLRLCVAAGLPTFCEKPVARSADEAAAVAREVADAGVPVQIGYPRRFDPAFAAVRAAVAGGELGWVHTVRSTTLDPAPPPRGYIEGSGGIFRDCSVHDFDAVRWVTGQEVAEVYAAGGNRGAEWFAEAGDVDTASAILTLADGALAVVSNSRYNARGYDVRLEVHGSRDSVAAGLGPSLPLRSAEPGVSFPDGKPYAFFMDRFAEAFRAELAAFTEVVAGRRTSPCPVADAVETGWVAEACALSLREHRPVRVDEVRRY